MSYTIENIAQIIGARRIGELSATIDWLLTDSRSLSFPEETLFFALATKRNDGARYIRDLYARGVRNFVVSEEGLKEAEALGSPLPDLNLLVVPSPLKALQKLAEQHHHPFTPQLQLADRRAFVCMADERANRTCHFGGGNLGAGRNARFAKYHQADHRNSNQYRRRTSGEFFLFAGEVHGKTGAF